MPHFVTGVKSEKLCSLVVYSSEKVWGLVGYSLEKVCGLIGYSLEKVCGLIDYSLEKVCVRQTCRFSMLGVSYNVDVLR